MGNRSNNINSSSKLELPEGMTWEEFISALNSEDNKSFLDSIDPETYRQILDDKNHLKLKRRFLKSLKKNDPENATNDYVESLISAMKEVAKNRIR